MSVARLPDRPLHLRVRVPRTGTWRLDRLVAEAGGIPVEEAAALIRHGSCRVDQGVVRQPERVVTAGRTVAVRYAPAVRQPAPALLHRDDALLVVRKPAGIPMQPTRQGAGNSLVEQVATQTGERDLRVVHRLDLPVSGVVALACGKAAARSLTRAFMAGEVQKVYLAAACADASGFRWLEEAGESPRLVDVPLVWLAGKQRALVAPEGRPSRSLVVAAGTSDGGMPLLLVRLLTGRTHQIRAHLAHAGLPLAGDAAYGAPAAGSRIALHSFFLALPHPVSGSRVVFRCDPEEDFSAVAGGVLSADRLASLAAAAEGLVRELL
jgi:23S rRNA-/tRNA-specific pseudouridylate synthase